MASTFKARLPWWIHKFGVWALAGFLPMAVGSAEARVIHWQLVDVPVGLSDYNYCCGSWSGSFDVAVESGSAQVRNIVIGGWPAGPLAISADGRSFGYLIQSDFECSYPDYDQCWPKYQESGGLTFAGDITKSRARIDVIGGGFDMTDCRRFVHCEWDYGSVGPGGYIVQVPEPAMGLLLPAGLFVTVLVARRRTSGQSTAGGARLP